MIKWFKYTDKWNDVKQSARTTIGMDGSGKYPTDKWKKLFYWLNTVRLEKLK